MNVSHTQGEILPFVENWMELASDMKKARERNAN